MDHTEKTVKGSFFSWIRFVILCILILGLFHFGIGIKIVSGHSMNPTLHDKGLVVVNKLFYKPERGDIVIVKDPDGFEIVKRIIGLPHDKTIIQNGIVYVNNKALKETYTKGMPMDMKEVTLNNQAYFLMGDNRTPGESLDSRDPNIGPVNANQIEGKWVPGTTRGQFDVLYIWGGQCMLFYCNSSKTAIIPPNFNTN